jgi:hypothetical protein
MDYAPDTCEDITFGGLAVGGPRCRVHNLEPNRCVAFEGTNTGRRFFMCSVGHVSLCLCSVPWFHLFIVIYAEFAIFSLLSYVLIMDS